MLLLISLAYHPGLVLICLVYYLPSHWLTPRKGVHLFRYFLPTMRTPVQLFPPHAYMHFYCSVVYALSAMTLNAYTKHLWCTQWVSCVHHNTIEMHICMRRKQLDWCSHCGQEILKQVFALSWCKPVNCISAERNLSFFHQKYPLTGKTSISD